MPSIAGALRAIIPADCQEIRVFDVDDKGHMRVQNPETLAQWLAIWRRWMLGEVGPDFPMCISAEHNWRSPQCWDPPEPPKPPLPEWIGLRVELAVRKLPEPYRTAVRIEILSVRQPGQTEAGFYDTKRRKARLPSWQYATVVDKSLQMLELSLGLGENSRGDRAPIKNA